MMKTSVVSLFLLAALCWMSLTPVSSFLPQQHQRQQLVPTSTAFARSLTTSKSTLKSTTTQLSAKYKTMDEILALFPREKPILINFYDAKTESAIKDDIFRAKTLLEDRATLVSIKQQDYPDLAKLWDAADKSPAMILFKDGQPVTRLYGETHYLEIVATIGKFCN